VAGFQLGLAGSSPPPWRSPAPSSAAPPEACQDPL